MTRQQGRRRMERKILELLVEGKGTREITRRLKVGDRRVRRIKALAQAHGYLSGRPLPAYPEAVFPENEPSQPEWISATDEKLGEQKEWIVERLKAGWSPITVFEELPVSVGRSSFYRFLRRHSLERVAEYTREQKWMHQEIVHSPGECLQLDWGKLRDVTCSETGQKKPLWAFVGVLGHSRYMMVRLVWSNDVATTLKALESMFQELGGVPAKITSDNPKCFALQASKFEPILHPAFERFGEHYGCRIELLPPRDPKKKGKVERMMPFVRRLYEAHGKAWHGLNESQEYLDKKVVIANRRKHGTTGLRPVEVFESEEKIMLQELPALTYEIEEYHSAKVRKDGFVRFSNKHYAVGPEHSGHEATIIANKEQVFIYIKGTLKETYPRLTDPHQSKTYKDHHLKESEKLMQDHAYLLKKAEKIGPYVLQVIKIILTTNEGFVDFRKIWGILSLDKTYSLEDLDKACRQSIELGSYSYQTVKSLLHLKQANTAASAPTQDSSGTRNNKFIRDINEYQEAIQKH